MLQMLRCSRISRSVLAFLFVPVVAPDLAAQEQLNCQHTKKHQIGLHHKGGGGVTLWPMDILHQRIELDLTLVQGIAASCQVTATPRSDGLDLLQLHLIDLTVDSVTSDGGTLPFTHSDGLLDISLESSVGIQDTVILTVHYHGIPALDPSGFGGFYITPSYIYNLGVAFTSVPHSYGRAWFPCVDDFTERNSYEFLVKSNAGKRAWCNGVLIDEIQLGGDTVVRHWFLEETIPAYLASMAASDYSVVRDTLTSISGSLIPVELVARPPDTTAMKNSFINLDQAFDAFEFWFGPYRWNKVGYVLTPQGAMEHSTSIHYPRSIANGTLLYEDIMAHELAHQWWGDLVTCDKAEEMYINEGFAEYLSYLFFEAVYGPDRYRAVVRANHRQMVHKAHLIDMGWWDLANVPQEWTYGEHSYNKGADIVHTLRGYLGDENFRIGTTAFLDAFAFSPVNSAMMRDHLTQVTGTDLSDFFEDWIFQPGWAAFEIDSFRVDPPAGSIHPTTVHVQQKLRGADHYYTNVPVSVTCSNGAGSWWTTPSPILIGGGTDQFSIDPPFAPVDVILNLDERISLAVTRDIDTLDQTGTRNYTSSDLRLTIAEVPTPFEIHMEEYWVAADPGTEEQFAFVVSPDRWWRIVGDIPADAVIQGRITYDGRPTTSGSLDIGLMQDIGGVAFNEDSLVLLYRLDQHHPWSVHPDHTVNPLNSTTDKFGRVDWNGVQRGEYTLGWRKSAVGSTELPRDGTHWTIHPNPAVDRVFLSVDRPLPGGTMIILQDMAGRTILRTQWDPNDPSLQLGGLPNGTYQLGSMIRGVVSPIGKFVVQH